MPDGSLQPQVRPTCGGHPPPPFACQWTRHRPEVTRVQVAGELDIATRSLLERTLRDVRTHTPLVVLDLHGLTFIDGRGTCLIAEASNTARVAGRKLVLVRTLPHVARVFALTLTAASIETAGVDALGPPAATAV